MSFLDKTFCESPNCKNDCGRQMSEQENKFLKGHPWYPVGYGYFCGEPVMTSEAVDAERTFKP